MIEKITSERKLKIDQIDNQLDISIQQELRKKIFEETEYEVGQLLKGGKKLVVDYIKSIKIIKLLEHYKKIIKCRNEIIKYIDEDIYSYMLQEFNNKIKKKKVEYEDISALLYLQYKIFGIDKRNILKHVLIDEAQDFGEFQFWIFNKILQDNKSITILGDIAQGIYSYRGVDNWNKINEIVFNNQASIERLNNSYRTTSEIMNEANKIIEKLKEKEDINLAIPINRHGEKVNYIKANSDENRNKIIINRINELKDKGYKNIAIITKDDKECKTVFEKIKESNINIDLITEELNQYSGNTIIIPSYLSKGLEFDSVIIYDFNKYEESNLDIKLLYVAMTRAMHTLDIITNK